MNKFLKLATILLFVMGIFNQPLFANLIDEESNKSLESAIQNIEQETPNDVILNNQKIQVDKDKLNLREKFILKQAVKKIKAKTEKEETTPKSQLVALLLVLFLGVMGIHRFYLGYTGIGVIQLLTLGGCGIWALVDLIMILTGDLKPADGSDYDPKF